MFEQIKQIGRHFIDRHFQPQILWPKEIFLSPKAIAIVVFSLGLVTTCGISIFDRKITLDNEEKLAIEHLAKVQTSLEEALYQRFTLVFSLEAFLKSYPHLDLFNPDDESRFQEHFDRFTDSLEQEVPGVLSLQLAPDGVVSYITNMERNRQALGHDILTDKKRHAEVIRTIHQGDVMIAGPLELVQGGNAIIARKPIFMETISYSAQRYINQNRAQPGDMWLEDIPSNFWGFTTVVIDTDTLYQEAGLYDESLYQYALKGQHGLGQSGDVFWGNAALFDTSLATATVSLPNGRWILGAHPIAGLGWGRRLFIGAIGIAISGCLGCSTYVCRNSERQLQQSNQALLQATRLKDEFLATMSHELRTPLNAILGLSEALQEEIYGATTAQQNHALQTIEKSGEHLLSLINAILDFSQVEAGQVSLTLASSNMDHLCQSILSVIQPQALKKQIHIQFQPSLAARKTDVIIDASRIRQVLLNLLNNAVKFTPEGGYVSLELNYAPSIATKTQHILLQISVRDTGIGIAPDDQARVFQPFIQVDSALNRQYEGTGLGLAIVKRIVELHGGEVQIVSEVGQGSCFTVHLPCMLGSSSTPSPQDGDEQRIEADFQLPGRSA